MGVVGVVGGGTMGAGIAHAFAAAGTNVVVVEVDAQRAERTRTSIEASLRRGAARGHVADADDAIGRLAVATEHGALVGAALVIEAVPEDPVLKADVLRKLEAVVPPGTVLATNTSSISVDALAATLAHRGRFLGMHFFNPVPASQLVELVHGRETTRPVVDEARRLAEHVGKQTIEVSDSPGFASSRLGLAIGLEAIRMLEEGVGSAADIDDAMVLGYRFPMGPLRLTDLVGLDVRLGIADYLTDALGDRFTPPRLLRDKVARGELGRKTGKGFFDWDREDPR